MKDKNPHLKLVDKQAKPEPKELGFALSISMDLQPVFENDEVILYRFQSVVAGEESLPAYSILGKVKLMDNK
jgi:hypothetical protein